MGGVGPSRSPTASTPTAPWSPRRSTRDPLPRVAPCACTPDLWTRGDGVGDGSRSTRSATPPRRHPPRQQRSTSAPRPRPPPATHLAPLRRSRCPAAPETGAHPPAPGSAGWLGQRPSRSGDRLRSPRGGPASRVGRGRPRSRGDGGALVSRCRGASGGGRSGGERVEAGPSVVVRHETEHRSGRAAGTVRRVLVVVEGRRCRRDHCELEEGSRWWAVPTRRDGVVWL